MLFGLGSLPAGRLGDLWGRRAMMIVFFLGMGLSALAIATVPGVKSLAVALTVPYGARNDQATAKFERELFDRRVLLP